MALTAQLVPALRRDSLAGGIEVIKFVVRPSCRLNYGTGCFDTVQNELCSIANVFILILVDFSVSCTRCDP